ncbi:MAG: DUF1552 domain-containing protein [Myxococcales bacterium]|nr:DUF1552 domain-containing protein [Myxococcales bacterium]
MLLRKPISRRAVLRGLGGAAMALPFLEAMRPAPARAQGVGGFPKRFLLMYTPNGTVPANFWPTGGETDFVLSPILEPLARHREDLLIVGGLDLLASLDGPGDAHQKGTGTCLTGVPLQEGDFPGDAGQSAGWANNISIDQEIARHFAGETRFSSLEFGVLVDGSDVKSRISYRGAGQPVPPENDPYAMYDRLFGDAGADAEATNKQNLRRRAMLDAVMGQYRRLHDRLGVEDRLKLQAHMESIRTIQDRLDRGSVQFGGACQPIDLGARVDVMRASNMPFVGEMQLDLMAMALACDLTRVASMMWTRSTSEVVFNWLGSDIREGHHPLAHKGDEDRVKVAQNTRINAWYAEQLAGLIDRLKAIPEGDGTVFDNTVILWTNEQAKGNNHDRNDMPYVLAGSAGGHFRTGRYLANDGRVGHNLLLVSLLQAFGIDADTFGTADYGTGPLSGLV